ncbi:MAG: c-type cytochrome [Verrucomicrobiales bacterium]
MKLVLWTAWLGMEKVNTLLPVAALAAGLIACQSNPEFRNGLLPLGERSTAALERITLDDLLPVNQRIAALKQWPTNLGRKHLTQLVAWSRDNNSPLQGTAIWSLGFAGGPDAATALEAIIADQNINEELRADAVIARANAMVHDVAFAEKWQTNGPAAVRHAAKFILGNSRFNDDAARPGSTAEWEKILGNSGNAERGRRLFFSPQLACSKCHAAEGRGKAAGPEFLGQSKSMLQVQLIEAIVDPSKQIDPKYQGFEIETKEGQTFTGLQAQQASDGSVEMLSMDGSIIQVDAKDVETFRPLNNSLMPDGLVEGLSVEDFRDLLSYLRQMQ